MGHLRSSLACHQVADFSGPSSSSPELAVRSARSAWGGRRGPQGERKTRLLREGAAPGTAGAAAPRGRASGEERGDWALEARMGGRSM